MPDTTPAALGQTWRSRDRRETRRVVIRDFTADPDGTRYAEVEPVGGGRRTRIRIDHNDQLTRYQLDKQ